MSTPAFFVTLDVFEMISVSHLVARSRPNRYKLLAARSETSHKYKCLASEQHGDTCLRHEVLALSFFEPLWSCLA